MNALSPTAGTEGRAPRVGTRSGAPRPTHRSGSVLDGYFDRAGLVVLLDAEDEVRLAKAMEAARAAADRLETGPLTRDERADLEAAVAAGAQARERFIAANLRLVVHIAMRHPALRAVELADLVQDGNIGLIEAVDRFDWRRGYRFSTYAAWWIRQSIQRGTACANRVIRLPYPLHDARMRIAAARERLQAMTGRDPSPRELALATRLDRQMVERALRIPPDALSLHHPVVTDGDSVDLGELVAVASDRPDDEVVEHLAFSAALRAARTQLDARSRHVLALRFGLDGREPMSYEAIGAEIGMSRESIRLIIKRALGVLRIALGEADADPDCQPRLPRAAGARSAGGARRPRVSRLGSGKEDASSERGRTEDMSDTNTTDRPGDEAPGDHPAAGENICPECSGSGEVDGRTCQNCQGEGYVTEGIGGA